MLRIVFAFLTLPVAAQSSHESDQFERFKDKELKKFVNVVQSIQEVQSDRQSHTIQF